VSAKPVALRAFRKNRYCTAVASAADTTNKIIHAKTPIGFSSLAVTLGEFDCQQALSPQLFIQCAVYCLEVTDGSHPQAFHSRSCHDFILSPNMRQPAEMTRSISSISEVLHCQMVTRCV
jgi:hypothetical protein